MLTQGEISQRLIELRNITKLYEQQRIQNQNLREENKILKQRIKDLEKENKDLKDKLTDFGYQLEEMKKIVFKRRTYIREILEEEDKETKEKRSKESYTRPIPKESEVTQVIKVGLPKNTQFSRVRTKTFYIEDIPLDIRNIVTKYEVTQYFDAIQNIWIGDMCIPLATVSIGQNTRMLVTTLCVEQRLSYSQIQQTIQLLYHMHISEGEIAKILEKESVLLEEVSYHILHKIQGDRYHHMDETSWPVGKDMAFAWSITDSFSSSYFTLGVSRGKGVAERLRGNTQGVLVSDDYVVYKNLSTHHQLCFAHLIRKWRDIATYTDFTEDVHARLQTEYASMKTLFRDLKESLTQPDREDKRQHFTERFSLASTIHPHDPPPLIRIKKRLRENISKYLTCLSFPDIPLTNNIAEQSLRHLVIKRRISFGSATQKGARVLSILMTVLKEILRTHRGSYFERYVELRGCRV